MSLGAGGAKKRGPVAGAPKFCSKCTNADGSRVELKGHRSVCPYKDEKGKKKRKVTDNGVAGDEGGGGSSPAPDSGGEGDGLEAVV